MQIEVIDAHELEQALDWIEVIDALEAALRSGAAPGNSPARSFATVAAGELILMPGEVGDDVGVKVVSVASDGAGRDLPRIQGVHVVFDGSTLRPRAILDAAALTLLRTAGLSALAVRHLAPTAAHVLVVFGTGPQARRHVAAIDAVRPLTEVVVVGRRGSAVAEMVEELTTQGFPARAGTGTDVGDADIVACCTSAQRPLFDSDRLRPEAAVVAIGSHSPAAREVDARLVARATVIVETRRSALDQAGDILLAIGDGVPVGDAITGELGDLVSGRLTPSVGTPRLFKGVGEAWSDVVVAAAALGRLLPGGP